MAEKIAKACAYALLVLLLAVGAVAIATNNSFALAQPCQAAVGSPNVSPQSYYYYGGNFQVTVPVSTSCSFYAGQLYAVGQAYDTTYNTYIGTANAVLSSTYGGYGYTGQLTFTLPISAQSHSVNFSVTIYGSQNGYYGGYYSGTPLAQTSSTFVIGPSYYQGYPTYPSYSAPSYPTYPSYPSYPSYPGYPYSNYYYYNNNGGYYYYYNTNGGYYHYYYYHGYHSSCGSWPNRCYPHH